MAVMTFPEHVAHIERQLTVARGPTPITVTEFGFNDGEPMPLAEFMCRYAVMKFYWPWMNLLCGGLDDKGQLQLALEVPTNSPKGEPIDWEPQLPVAAYPKTLQEWTFESGEWARKSK